MQGWSETQTRGYTGDTQGQPPRYPSCCHCNDTHTDREEVQDIGMRADTDIHDARCHLVVRAAVTVREMEVGRGRSESQTRRKAHNRHAAPLTHTPLHGRGVGRILLYSTEVYSIVGLSNNKNRIRQCTNRISFVIIIFALAKKLKFCLGYGPASTRHHSNMNTANSASLTGF